MSVLLIKPYYKYEISIMPPIGLCYIAAELRKNGIRVGVLDNTLENLDESMLKIKIAEFSPLIIGIYSATPMIEEALNIARLTRRVSKKIHIILGGPHPSAMPEDIIKNEFVDSVCIQEGEYLLSELYTAVVSDIPRLKEIKGLVYKTPDKETIYNSHRDLISDLDNLPFPAYDLLPIERYFKRGETYGIGTKSSRTLPIITSRGCPYNCTFCQRFMGKKFRMRGAKNVLDEMQSLMKTYDIEEIHIVDDNFSLDKKRAIDIINGIRHRKLKINLKFPNGLREDILDAELMSKLKEVGCYNLHFGIESGSQRTLNLMKKHKTINDIRSKVCLAKNMKFSVSANFIFGTPGETLKDMEKTIKFATSLPLDGASFGIVVPFPGTEVRKIAEENNFLTHSDFSKYTISLGSVEPAIETNEFNKNDLKKIQKIAYIRFYCRPKIFFKLVTYLHIWPKTLKILRYLRVILFGKVQIRRALIRR